MLTDSEFIYAKFGSFFGIMLYNMLNWYLSLSFKIV